MRAGAACEPCTLCGHARGDCTCRRFARGWGGAALPCSPARCLAAFLRLFTSVCLVSGFLETAYGVFSCWHQALWSASPIGIAMKEISWGTHGALLDLHVLRHRLGAALRRAAQTNLKTLKPWPQTTPSSACPLTPLYPSCPARHPAQRMAVDFNPKTLATNHALQRMPAYSPLP